MTIESTAWAIDGALLGSSLARRAEFAAVGGAQGIVQKADLKVHQLAVPGVGVRIDAGVGLISNGYQTTPNETYVVSNDAEHTIPSGEMPASNPSAKSYIVAIVVGDPDFSQVGHPWMGAGDPPVGEELTFQYVRATLIEVSAGATSLDVDYPALPLARIDVPASTTTIIDSYITDLRKLARPRQEQQLFVSTANLWNSPNVYIPSGATYADWGAAQFAPSVKVPSWATRAIICARVNGAALSDPSININGSIRAILGGVAGPACVFDTPIGSSGIRMNLEAAGSYDVSSLAGTTATLKVQGFENVPASPTTNQTVRLMRGSQMVFDVRFFEE